MASRQSTSKARPGRNRAPSARRTRSTRLRRQPRIEESEPEAFGPLKDAIENERGELARVNAMLGCLYLSLLYCDWSDEEPCNFADVAKVARRLISDSMDRLDSVYIGPLLKRIASARPRGG
jgi:hypothetical protein